MALKPFQGTLTCCQAEKAPCCLLREEPLSVLQPGAPQTPTAPSPLPAWDGHPGLPRVAPPGQARAASLDGCWRATSALDAI